MMCYRLQLGAFSRISIALETHVDFRNYGKDSNTGSIY